MLLIIGTSHKAASIAIREKLAVAEDALSALLQALSLDPRVQEVVLLSTCNRTEFYVSTSSSEEEIYEAVVACWQKWCPLVTHFKDYVYIFSKEAAISHLMRLACGLDSLILGEPQVLGQLKSAFVLAKGVGTLGKELAFLFQKILHVAKKIRSQTGIAGYPVSVAYAAVTLAKKHLHGVSRPVIVLIGAGKNIELTLKYLVTDPIPRIVIVNRTFSRAEILAKRFGVEAAPLEHLSDYLEEADGVISAVSSQTAIVTRTHLRGRFQKKTQRPLFIIDLGVPRNIEADLSKEVVLYTVDDLNAIVTKNLKARETCAREAEASIPIACQAYIENQKARQKLQVVKAFRLKTDTIKKRVVEEALYALQKGEAPEAVMKQLAHRLAQKLLHRPTISLRKHCLEHSQDTLRFAKEFLDLESL